MRKETTRDKEKKEILDGRQGESNEKTPRDKKGEQVDLGKTRGKIKRQRRHSKWENVEKVFWSGNSEEIKKRKCQNE